MSQLLTNLSQRYQEGVKNRLLYWEGNFEEYEAIIKQKPWVTQTAFQRLDRMIEHYGCKTETRRKEKVVIWQLFSDPMENGKDALFGLEDVLSKFKSVICAAAKKYGPEKRVLLLCGPVGSAKSTIVRLLKKGLEAYSLTDDGAVYSFMWRKELLGANLSKLEENSYVRCPNFEEPLHLVPLETRKDYCAGLEKEIDEKIRKQFGQKLMVEGELCPFCRDIFHNQLRKYEGDFARILKEDVRIYRVLLSEKDRRGIGTFQPKDEKNQDSTELTGDINWRKVSVSGRDSDPKAFNFDGEFNIANRGLIEFVEVLKLDVAFLYDLLGASQEHRIKPKKFPQTDIDQVIIGHTNEPELRRLENNELMEALRDRTIRINVPYVVRLNDELKIYERDYNSSKVADKHIAPHTLEMAAMWAVLSRLDDPKKANLSRIQKLKLYNGKTLSGYTDESIRELREEALYEGMEGVSPRYVQDKISNAIVNNEEGCINPFMVLTELEEGLKHSAIITGKEQRKQYQELMTVVREEYEDIVKNEVRVAIAADEDALARLCSNYIDNVRAYTQKEKVKNKFTGKYEDPDEELMRAVEEKIDIPENRKDDFRREIMNYIGALAVDGKKFDYKTNERLQKALELKLFEDQKDTIKLSQVVSATMDPDTEEKIKVVKKRMKDHMGYCEICSTDVLNFVASIFARGEIKEKE